MKVGVADGVETKLSSVWWRFIGPLAWLGDGSRLLVIASERAELPLQIWSVSYSDGEAKEFTNDTNYYSALSLTADSRNLVSIQSESAVNIWTTTLDGSGDHDRKIMLGANKTDGDLGVSWTPSGQIVYETNVNQNFDIWLMDPDGRNRKQLTTDPHADAEPTVSPDGQYVVFVSERTGTRNIWRMNLDGSNQRQLSGGRFDNDPQCSPDGKWIVYTSSEAGKGTLQRISTEGGQPTSLTDKEENSQAPVVSPDGHLIAFFFFDQTEQKQWKIGLINSEGGPLIKTFPLPKSVTVIPNETGIRWMPHGRSLIYISNQGGVSNAWEQPLDGGTPRQLTNFKADTILSFDLSREGGQLVFARGSSSSDAVMITDFR